MSDESDRDRLSRVSDKALTQIAQATAALDVQFVAILRTATELRVYCSDEADIRELFEGALPSIEEVPEGATLN